ncbi:MAG: hypothetical protein ACI30X_07055 [Muribaculaceae bacterium]
MSTLLDPHIHYDIDFSGRFVRINNSVIDRSGLAYVIGHIDYYTGLIMANQKYHKAAERLKSLLQEKQYNNVSITM